ncbi:MAG TPA: Gfo/Idh/MocA family oxidoreductase [Cyclobacteriaceae bacterium]|nr:Gfo/Idh/MocA family oxidoreductase [Cyclobacteriaceae bacterium]HRJ81510.1 Gfo/Idh/MocA family oxidoreductase [Cyclobacteriaceae bacterium]
MKRINTVLLSYGMSGKVFHAPFLSVHGGFQVRGAWERSKKVFAQDYPGTKSYASLESVLEDEEVELVIVNTPTNSHYEYARKALLANKHVIVEKAFTTTVTEAEELKAIAEQRQRKLSVFQNRRWDSDFKTVKQVILAGLLGDIVEATLCFDRYNAGLSKKTHKENPGPGAGIVYDLVPHLADQALVLFGMPQAVFADFMINRPASRVEDYFELLLYYNNFRVRLLAGYFKREPAPSYQIHGKLGSFFKSRADVQEASLLGGIKPNQTGYGIEPEEEQGLLHTEKDGVVMRERISTLPGNYMDYFEAVYKAITADASIPVSADDGINVMKIIEAAYTSHRERKVVAI